MVDEAFALSPINASASLPSDNDYDAICDAFMETSRGRWFLSEYAKRNRHADTQKVLEAIARLEQNLARQKQESAEQPVPEPVVTEVPAPEKIDIFPAVQAVLIDTRAQLAQCVAAGDDPAAMELLKSGMDTIRSVTWALRERGVDLQICGIFDHQVSLMMDGYLRLSTLQTTSSTMPAQVLAMFDDLMQRIAGIAAGEPAAGPVEAVAGDTTAIADVATESERDLMARAVAPSDARDDVAAQVLAPAIEAAAFDAPAGDPDSAFRQIYGDDHDIEILDSPMHDATTDLVADAEDSFDLAADDETTGHEDDDFIQAIADTAQELARLEPLDTVMPSAPFASEPAVPAPSLETASLAPRYVPETIPDHELAAAAAMSAAPAPDPLEAEVAAIVAGTSLGAAVLRNGLVQPKSRRNDPLAAFARMTQAEKIAFAT